MRPSRCAALVALLLACGAPASAQWNELNPVTAVQRQNDGVQFTMRSGLLQIQVCSSSILRVRYSRESALPKKSDFVVIKSSWPAIAWQLSETPQAVAISTAT